MEKKVKTKINWGWVIIQIWTVIRMLAYFGLMIFYLVPDSPVRENWLIVMMAFFVSIVLDLAIKWIMKSWHWHLVFLALEIAVVLYLGFGVGPFIDGRFLLAPAFGFTAFFAATTISQKRGS